MKEPCKLWTIVRLDLFIMVNIKLNSLFMFYIELEDETFVIRAMYVRKK